MSFLEKLQNNIQQKQKEIHLGSLFDESHKKFVLFVDVSGSMYSEIYKNNKKKYDVVIDTVLDIAKENRDAIFQIVLYDDNYSVFTPEQFVEIVTADRYRFIDYMHGGSTNLHKAIVSMKQMSNMNDFIILSDGLSNELGFINDTYIDIGRLKYLLKEEFGEIVPKFNTVFVPDHSEHMMEVGEKYMKKLADATGGKFYHYSKDLKMGKDPIFSLKSGIKGFLEAGR